mgnify:CR=1 FL=1
MEFSFDKIANVLYIRFSYDEISDTEEIEDGIIIDYNANGKIIGIEILNYRERGINLNELVQLSEDEIVPVIIQWQ